MEAFEKSLLKLTPCWSVCGKTIYGDTDTGRRRQLVPAVARVVQSALIYFRTTSAYTERLGWIADKCKDSTVMCKKVKSAKMEALSLLLLFTVYGYSYKLHASLDAIQIAGKDEDHLSEMRSKLLRDERKHEDNMATMGGWRGESMSPETNSTASPTASVNPVSQTEDPLTEVLHTPGPHNKQNVLPVLSPKVENVKVKNLVLKPAHVVLKTRHTIIQPNERPSPAQASGEYELSGNKRMQRNQRTKAQLTTSKSQLSRQTQNKSSKKDTKAQRPSDEKKEEEEHEIVVTTVTHFPYFMDNYCPPECACYGRVIQCSDKGVGTVPYGIPYNARYILLMNNLIAGIQPDLLSEYVSMEFLVLSNNQLTNAAIDGAFHGVPALKRLYLDRNLLQNVPIDLPVSLEEIRLDNNGLSVMSETAWPQCPGLRVLSLSNNSLGHGSGSLPNAVFAPLHQLRTLNLDHNQLTSVPLGLPLSIKELYLKGNLIEHFRGGVFNGLSGLVLLDLSANRLTDKGLLRDSLANASHLESINFEGNRLKQVPRHLPLSLKTLNLEGNLITSIKKAAFRTLRNLEHLGLARNKIAKVAPGAFRALPVLHQLDLCHNALHQVPRQLPPTLHSAAFTHNKIESVPRDAFCWDSQSPGLSGLVRVQLEQNFIDMGKLDVQAFRCLRGFQVVNFY